MFTLRNSFVVICLLLWTRPGVAQQPITAEMIEVGGGLQEYGKLLEKDVASLVGTKILGMPILRTHYHMFPPTHTLTFSHDTPAFVKKLIARVQKAHPGKYKMPEIVMGYVMVFERDRSDLAAYLSLRVAERMAREEWVRSYVQQGYRLNFSFYHREPFSLEMQVDGETQQVTLDRIGKRKLDGTKLEEIELGVSGSADYLKEAIARMLEAIDSGKAKARYEIVDYPDDTLWKKRTLALMKQAK